MCVHIGVCHVAVTDTSCISCSCHWQFLKYPVCTFHTIFHWHIYPEWISYTCLLKYFLCAFQCCHWNVFLFHCMSSNGWFNKNDIHTNPPPPTPNQPKLDPLKTMKNEERNNYHHAQMQKCILLKYLKEVWHRHGMLHIHVYTVKIRQTRYTYHLFAAWIGGICWPKGFAYIYLS